MLRKIISGIAAGLMISLGGTVYLACENRTVGAFCFTIGLLGVCYYGFSLYTGRIGYIAEKHDTEYLSGLFLGLLGNLIGTILCGLAVRLATPWGSAAETAAAAKLALPAGAVLVKAGFCGILVYAAVNLFRDKKTALGILIGIPVFILSGFEHSVADMFYLSAAGIFTPAAAWFIVLVLIGNSAGAVLFDRLVFYSRERKKN